MSKNFELMQRAGKLLDIEFPPPAEMTAAPASASVASLLQTTFSPTLAPSLAPRARKWFPGRATTRLTAAQTAREESHKLVQQVFMTQSQDPPRVVVFAGIDHGNGCSHICAHAAEALCDNLRGLICLVEANFRSPSLSRLYEKANHRGLTNALAGEGSMRSFAKPLAHDKFFLLSCGSPVADPHSLLNSSRLKGRFQDLRKEFDYVVIDAPPLTRYSDAFALAKIADGIVLVLEENATRRESAIRITEHLRASGIRILAAVLNKRTYPIPESLYRQL
jgi:receptor protein-tyrosine kinase